MEQSNSLIWSVECAKISNVNVKAVIFTFKPVLKNRCGKKYFVNWNKMNN